MKLNKACFLIKTNCILIFIQRIVWSSEGLGTRILIIQNLERNVKIFELKKAFAMLGKIT